MKSHAEKMQVVHAIWLCADDKKLSGRAIMRRAAKLLRMKPSQLFEEFDYDYLDRAWCSRPPDWKPGDSLRVEDKARQLWEPARLALELLERCPPSVSPGSVAEAFFLETRSGLRTALYASK